MVALYHQLKVIPFPVTLEHIPLTILAHRILPDCQQLRPIVLLIIHISSLMVAKYHVVSPSQVPPERQEIPAIARPSHRAPRESHVTNTPILLVYKKIASLGGK